MGIKLKNNILSFLLVMLSAAGFTSCGLDTFYMVNPPSLISNAPRADTQSKIDIYTEIITGESSNNHLDSSFSFEGTDIYYRIYANKDTLTSHRTGVDTRNTATNYTGAVSYIINTLKYQRLTTNEGKFEPLIQNNELKNTNDKYVKIRLTDMYAYNELSRDEEYVRQITIKDKNRNGTLIKKYIPLRFDGKYTFNFGHHVYDVNSPLPQSGDEDFESGTVTDNKYYVCLYAFSRGHDVTFAKYYSQLIYLGTFVIDADSGTN